MLTTNPCIIFSLLATEKMKGIIYHLMVIYVLFHVLKEKKEEEAKDIDNKYHQ